MEVTSERAIGAPTRNPPLEPIARLAMTIHFVITAQRHNVKPSAESSRTHTRIARAGGHMKIDITTTTVFALFYAIMFGGMLNWLSDWSAFARADAAEKQGKRI